MKIWFRKAPPLASYNKSIPRDVLIQSSRILFVDDEEPLLIKHLSNSGFSVDHDRTGTDHETQVVAQYYELVILDFSGVGQKYGDKEGLDVLKFIRRVSPRTRVLSYTSRALNSNDSDFYRLADAVLPKDAGLRESLEAIEEQIQKALAKEYLFEALITKLEIASGDRLKLTKALESALERKDEGGFKEFVRTLAGSAAEKGVDVLLSKIFL